MTVSTSRHGVCVDQNYFWQSMETCPRGRKVQLLGKGGLPTHSIYDGKDTFWIGWAPIPKKPDWMK